jgi:hypothetical protein
VIDAEPLTTYARLSARTQPFYLARASACPGDDGR